MKTIRQSMIHPRKLILRNFLSPGDIVMLTAAIRDLHLTFPQQFQTDVRTPTPELWENNPYITPLAEENSDVEIVDCDYPLVNQSNQLPYHFVHGFRHFLCEKLGVNIRSHGTTGDIHITAEEKQWTSQVDEITGMADTRFWIIVGGGKNDYTAKWWDPARYQQVIDHFKDRVLFVQCGAEYDNHTHKRLDGVIDFVGRTDLRQLVRLMYHADGVICPVTLFMHLAAAVETKPGRPANRPCVVVAGGREPMHWEAYSTHQYIHRVGCLPCCDHGGCWRSRVIPLNDGAVQDDSLCLYPIAAESGAVIPKCMDMIGAHHVIDCVEQYLKYPSFAWRTLLGYGTSHGGAS